MQNQKLYYNIRITINRPDKLEIISEIINDH